MNVLRPCLALLALSLAASASAQPDGSVVARDTMRFSEDARERFGRFVAARIGAEDAEGVFDRVTIERVTYLSDGLRIAGYLATPADSGDAERLPAVVYTRGGTGSFGALDSVAVAAVLVPLAARGYVVVVSQYRGAPGSEGRDEYGGADVADVLNLLPVLWTERIPSHTPLLVLHGTADDRVRPETALSMTAALLAAERPVRLVLYEGASHRLSPFRGEAFAETVR